MRPSLKFLVVSLVALAGLLPVIASAQDSPPDDLRNTIQNSVLADPRVAGIPPAQLQGLVDALVAEANAQHMTSADILWRPQSASAATFAPEGTSSSGACTPGWQGYLCEFNQVFGFEGVNYEIPILLLVTSAFLIAVIWELILHHRKKLAKRGL